MQPIQFDSCFISYNSEDMPHVESLHADLQAKGVRCRYAPEELEIGKESRTIRPLAPGDDPGGLPERKLP
jgi:hypothetical protein